MGGSLRYYKINNYFYYETNILYISFDYFKLIELTKNLNSNTIIIDIEKEIRKAKNYHIFLSSKL